MKKIIFAITLGCILTLNILPTMASKVDEILPLDIITERVGTGTRELLPKGELKKEIVPRAIGLFLALAGTISFSVFVYAGVMLIIAQGNEEEITKFKNILIWSIVGMAFIGASYALVSGVMQLVFK